MHWKEFLNRLDLKGNKLDQVDKIIADTQLQHDRLQQEIYFQNELITKHLVKLSHSLAVLEQESLALQAASRDNALALNKPPGSVFDRLKELHDQMLAAEQERMFLKDADNWNSIADEMDAFIANLDFEKASKRIGEAEKSLVVVQDVDVDARRAMLDKLLASMEPELVKSCGDPQMVVAIFGYYKAINKASVFADKWVDIARINLVQRSESVLNVDLTLMDMNALVSFISFAKQECTHNYSFAKANFNQQVALMYLKSILGAIERHLKTVLAKVDAKSIDQLVQVYKLFADFLVDLNHELTLADTAPLAHFAQLFVSYQKKYGPFEAAYLDHKTLDILSQVLKQGKLMSELAETAFTHCTIFTYGTGYNEYLKVLDDFYIRVINHSTKELRPKLYPADRTSNVMIHLTDQDWQKCHETVEFLGDAVDFYHAIKSIQKGIPKRKVVETEAFLHVSTLNAYFGSDATNASPLSESVNRAEKFVSQCQRDVLESFVVHVKPFVEQVSNHDWTIKLKDTAVPQFSLSPQPYITAIGEYLLTLPQHMDTLMQNDCLSFQVTELPFLLNSDLDGISPDTQESYEVGFLWISSIVRFAESAVFNKYMAIERISEQGRKQVLADIDYLLNIFAALEIELNPEFKDIHELLKVTDAEYKHSKHKDSANYARIAEMRGIEINQGET